VANIQDVMSSDLTVAGKVQFAVNSAVLEVAAVPPVAPVIFFNANGMQWFNIGDNVLLQNLWVNIPYGFGQGDGQHTIGLAWIDALAGITPIPELAGNSILTIPSLCGPLDFPSSGLFVKVPTNVGRVRLGLTSLALNVAQVGVPAVIADGTVFKIQYHIELFHTQVLVGAP
jgi:hypothetical protein